MKRSEILLSPSGQSQKMPQLSFRNYNEFQKQVYTNDVQSISKPILTRISFPLTQPRMNEELNSPNKKLQQPESLGLRRILKTFQPQQKLKKKNLSIANQRENSNEIQIDSQINDSTQYQSAFDVKSLEAAKFYNLVQILSSSNSQTLIDANKHRSTKYIKLGKTKYMSPQGNKQTLIPTQISEKQNENENPIKEVVQLCEEKKKLKEKKNSTQYEEISQEIQINEDFASNFFFQGPVQGYDAEESIQSIDTFNLIDYVQNNKHKENIEARDFQEELNTNKDQNYYFFPMKGHIQCQKNSQQDSPTLELKLNKSNQLKSKLPVQKKLISEKSQIQKLLK